MIVEIRKAEIKDEAGMQIVEAEAFAMEKSMVSLFFNLRAEAKSCPCYLEAAVDQETQNVLGYAIARLDNKGCGLIYSLAVDSKYQGLHLGRALLDKVSQSLVDSGANKIILQVRTDNDRAIGLYERSGFVRHGYLEKFYPNGKDAYVMVKTIPF